MNTIFWYTNCINDANTQILKFTKNIWSRIIPGSSCIGHDRGHFSWEQTIHSYIFNLSVYNGILNSFIDVLQLFAVKCDRFSQVMCAIRSWNIHINFLFRLIATFMSMWLKDGDKFHLYQNNVAAWKLGINNRKLLYWKCN